jgi:serine phosphatase RsbU (regulator of sigma subunit)/anti-sigma regulatory factor (Ser/Thr protein kinase)
MDRREGALAGLAGPAPDEVQSEARADLRLLSRVSYLLAKSLNRITIASELAELVVENWCDVCAIHLIDSDGGLQKDAIACADRSEEAAVERAFLNALTSIDGFIREAMRSGQGSAYQRARLDDSPVHKTAFRLLRALGAGSLLVVPLWIGATCIGAISFVESKRSRPFEAPDLEIASTIGCHFSTSLENVALRDRERRIGDRSRFVARATDHVLSTLDRTDMLQRLLNVIVDEFADWAVVSSITDGGLYVTASATMENETLPGTAPVNGVRLFGSIAERRLMAALSEQRPLLVSETAVSPATVHGSGATDVQPQAWMMAPLLVAGTTYGALICYSQRHRYADADLEILQELARRASVALEHSESFARERRLAQTLQQATLPTNLAAVKGAALSAVYLPAALEERVGGDWYDAFALDEHRVLLTVGDVTGHGLEASVIMGKLRHAINVVAMYETDPARILDVAEHIVLGRFPQAIATAFVAVLDARTGTLTYANAGHPHPMVRLLDGSIETLSSGGLPIGLRNMGDTVPATSTQLHANLLALYTDGLIEATRDSIEGERRLIETLAYEAVLVVNNAADFIRARSGVENSPDDVAILTLNFVPMDRWTFLSYDQRMAQETRSAVVQRLRERGVVHTEKAEIVFGELVANVVRYAPGMVDVALHWDEDRPILHVIDRGRGYPDTCQPATDILSETGRGLWLINALGASLSTTVIPGFGHHTRVVLLP